MQNQGKAEFQPEKDPSVTCEEENKSLLQPSMLSTSYSNGSCDRATRSSRHKLSPAWSRTRLAIKPVSSEGG